MKSAIAKVLVFGLLLTQIAEAGVARRYSNQDTEAQQIVRALKLLPDATFRCKITSEHGSSESEEYFSGLIEWIDQSSNYALIQYDSATPLFDFQLNPKYEYKKQLTLYTNSQKTEVNQIVIRTDSQRTVNKGTLESPKIVDEDYLSRTATCVKKK